MPKFVCLIELSDEGWAAARHNRHYLNEWIEQTFQEQGQPSPLEVDVWPADVPAVLDLLSAVDPAWPLGLIDQAWPVLVGKLVDDLVSVENPIPWREWLPQRCELRATSNGVQWWLSANCHYFVYNGRVLTHYGHAEHLFEQLQSAEGRAKILGSIINGRAYANVLK